MAAKKTAKKSRRKENGEGSHRSTYKKSGAKESRCEKGREIRAQGREESRPFHRLRRPQRLPELPQAR
ncbi:hypothetical protein OVA24_03945 [Luteolibacter sp. SL250]|uniref:hypothetical protein n=1 Tax=Luteolibacter sp. SL250 TaxID=2995170 RepID=UPI002271DCB1|nr:hypothetical protein [Luteolibacter sp. SL250]WAC20530.1 hypothetical protein OVA24_03945 [Luteolibacter sp. SL250]